VGAAASGPSFDGAGDRRRTG